jgi:hypothetical protein
MTPLDFLAAVLPSAGNLYCMVGLPSREHIFKDTVDELHAEYLRLEASQQDTYFALFTYAEPNSRKAPNAVETRAFFLDIDCAEVGSKTYGTKEEGLAAFMAFCSKTGLDKLGDPFIVDSGGGYHVYWPLKENVAAAIWKPVAENFKRLCKQEALKVDMTVPADVTQLLRVPGTTNWKRVNKFDTTFVVTIVQEAAATVAFAEFDACIRAALTELPAMAAAPSILPGSRPKAAKPVTTVKLFENSVTYFKNILVKTQAGTGCNQLTYYMTHATEDGMEPLWRGMLSIAQKCEDGAKAVVFLSNRHPYPVERMQQKLREIKGPYPCTKLDSENPGICTSCAHFGKITNPLSLGREVLVDRTEKIVEATPAAASPTEEVVPVKYIRPVPPRGFSYGQKGGIFREIETLNAEGEKTTEQKMVLAYDMFIMDILKPVGGEHTIHMVAMRPEGVVDIMFPQKAVISKDELSKALAAQNIISAFGAGNDAFLTAYVRGCVETYSAERGAISVPASYGWQKDGTFVHNNNIYSPNDRVRRSPMPGLENLLHVTGREGTLEGWRKRFGLLISSTYNAQEDLNPLLAAACVGFGAPMMIFTGLNGMTIHLGHRESGTGKTLALSLCASIWGHPDRYKVGATTSDVAMIQRAGLLGSLPVISDEITTKNRADMEWFPGYCFGFSEGGGKERMESGANKERINTSFWHSLSLMSSNTHVSDYMTGPRKHSSEGELRRMLDYKPHKKLRWTDPERLIVKTLKDNYGVAGPIFAQWMVNNRDTCQQLVNEVTERLRKEFSAVDDERYWVAGCAAIVVGCIVAGSKYANVIDLPIEAIVKALRKMVEEQRALMAANVRSAEDVLNSYIREYYGNFVVLAATTGIGASFGDGEMIERSTMRSEIAGRVEHNTSPGFTDFYIEEQLLKGYCSSMSFGYSDFKLQLEALYRVIYPRKFDLMRKTNGPQMRVNCLMLSRPKDLDETYVPDKET